MRNYLFSLGLGFVLLIGLPTMVSGNQNIDTLMSNQDIRIYSFDEVRINGQHFDSENVLLSYIDLELVGRLEGNICPHNKIGIFKTINKALENGFESNLSLRAFTQSTQPLGIGDAICTLPCKAQQFSVTVRVEPYSWGSMPQKTWIYRLKDANRAVGIFKVDLDEQKGWSLEKISQYQAPDCEP